MRQLAAQAAYVCPWNVSRTHSFSALCLRKKAMRARKDEQRRAQSQGVGGWSVDIASMPTSQLHRLFCAGACAPAIQDACKTARLCILFGVDMRLNGLCMLG